MSTIDFAALWKAVETIARQRDEAIRRADELEAIVNDGGNQAAKYWRLKSEAEADAARRLRNLEMAVAERDELRAVIAEALAEEERCTDQGTRMWRILSRIPEHPKEGD